jgi:cytochrome c oxidase subunit 2
MLPALMSSVLASAASAARSASAEALAVVAGAAEDVAALASQAEAAAGQLVMAPQNDNLFFPEQGSTIAKQIDDVFYFILWVSIISFVGCIGAGLWFMWRYRARPGHREEVTSAHDTRLEITWTVIPTLLVAVMFYVGFEGFMNLREAPGDAYTINVTARQWAWDFSYPNGAKDSDLHVPAGKPVRLLMSSEDVLHSLYIPSFRVKQDVVPGRYTSLWFEALLPSEQDQKDGLHLFCTEYCGTDHWNMNRRVFVYPPAEFEAKIQKLADFLNDPAIAPAEKGRRIYTRACASCHLTTGDTKIGPGFQLVSNALKDKSALEFDGSPSLVPDENYLRESILVPAAKIRKGYPNQMNSFQGQLSDQEIGLLITFIKSISDPTQGVPAGQ